MKLIDRYVARQLITTALFAVGVLSLVLVLGNIFKQILGLLVNHDVPIEYILSFIGYIFPFSLTYTVPWGFLTAVLLVFGKMSAENELIALRSSGVSILRICLPVFALALLSVALCLWINISVAPRAQEQMKNALFQIATSNPIAMFGSDQVIDEFPGRKIYVGRKHGTMLEDILMYELDDDNEPIKVVHAREGELRADIEGRQEITLLLKDARYEQRDAADPQDLTRVRQGITAQKIPLPIPLKELYEKNQKRRGLSQLTLTELLDTRDKKQISAARTEVNKRFSFSLASFALALAGIPLAITAHRRETSIGFMFSLVIAFVYFMLLQMVEWVKMNPNAHPELLIWTPNILFIGLGTFLFIRLARR